LTQGAAGTAHFEPGGVSFWDGEQSAAQQPLPDVGKQLTRNTPDDCDALTNKPLMTRRRPQSDPNSSGRLERRFVAGVRMHRTSWTPSIVPTDSDETVYLVADDFGQIGRAWRESDYNATDLETVIQDLLSGEYRNPIRVVAFNTAERWSDDVSEDVARELRRRCDLQLRDLPSSVLDFVERYEGHTWQQLTLRLV
jgi:hypothetical protein